MRKFVTALAVSLTASVVAMPALAQDQDIVIETLDIAPLRYVPLEIPLGDVTSETVVPATVGQSAMLRGLDKLTGQVADFELQNGYSVNFGTLRVDMAQCRHPSDNATGEAYAFISVFEDQGAGENLFSGLDDCQLSGAQRAGSPTL